MERIVIVSVARTAIGKFNGSLKDFEASDLGGIAIKAAINRAGLTLLMWMRRSWVVWGPRRKMRFGRMSALRRYAEYFQRSRLTACVLRVAGHPDRGVRNRDRLADIVLPASQSMTNILFIEKSQKRRSHGRWRSEDGLITALSDPFYQVHMGITAKRAEKYQISREDQDLYARESGTSATCY